MIGRDSIGHGHGQGHSLRPPQPNQNQNHFKAMPTATATTTTSSSYRRVSHSTTLIVVAVSIVLLQVGMFWHATQITDLSTSQTRTNTGGPTHPRKRSSGMAKTKKKEVKTTTTATIKRYEDPASNDKSSKLMPTKEYLSTLDVQKQKQQQISSQNIQSSSTAPILAKAPSLLQPQPVKKPIETDQSSSTSSSSSSTSSSHDNHHPPKLLIGIMSGNHNAIQRTYRNRHRQLFQLWNETRLCSLGQYVHHLESRKSINSNNNRGHVDDYDSNFDPNLCQVLYTFVIGAYQNNNANNDEHDNDKESNITPLNKNNEDNDNHDDIPTIIVDETTMMTHRLSNCSHLANNNNLINDREDILIREQEQRRPLTLETMPVWMIHYNDIYHENYKRKSTQTNSKIKNHDVTILNIRENMNEGKTPTFLYWSSRIASRYNITYVAKCDSDSVMRWPSLLNFINKQLPMTSTTAATSRVQQQEELRSQSLLPWVVMGFIRSKATWMDEAADETRWKLGFQTGLHLYLTGSFFLMSTDLARGAAIEVRNQVRNYYHSQLKKVCRDPIQNHQHQQQQQDLDATSLQLPPFSFKNLSYFEGHEDHDALSAAQVFALDQGRAIRWILPLKVQHFWEHPVKGMGRWERIWNRETKRKTMTDDELRSTFHWTDEAIPIDPSSSVLESSPNRSPKSSASLLIILGAETEEQRRTYRNDLYSQQRKEEEEDNHRVVCKFPLLLTERMMEDQHDEKCDVYYFFAIGKTGNGVDVESLPKKIVNDTDSMVDINGMKSSSEDDILRLNIQHNVDEGIGETILNWIEHTGWISNTGSKLLDVIVFSQVSFRFDISKWIHLKSDHGNFRSPTTAISSQSVTTDSPFFLVGDIRDRRQIPLEFPRPIHHQNRTESSSRTTTSAIFDKNLEGIHLYMGSDCFVVSSNLVPYIVEQAKVYSNITKSDGDLFVGNIGHDMTSYAHLASQQHSKTIVLQWVPVPTSLRFWSEFRDNTNEEALTMNYDLTSREQQQQQQHRDKLPVQTESISDKAFVCSYGKGENVTTVRLPSVAKPPSFIMIGVQKSGSTALLSYLRDYHPNVLQTKKALRREAHFFDTAWHGLLKRCTNMGLVQAKEKYCLILEDYMKLFQVDKIESAAQNADRTKQLYTFEKTPSYFCNPNVPLRIRQIVPWSKVILILRNPVDRFYSHYKMSINDVMTLRSKTLEDFLYHEVDAMRKYQMTNAPLPSVNTNITDHPQVPWDHTLPESNWNPKKAINAYTDDPLLGHQILLRRGLYAIQLQWWLKHFTLNENLLVINYKDMLEDSRAVLHRVLEFADIPIITIDDVNATSNSSTTPYKKVRADKRKGDRPMSNTTRRYLQQFYAPYNAQLESLLGPEWNVEQLAW